MSALDLSSANNVFDTKVFVRMILKNKTDQDYQSDVTEEFAKLSPAGQVATVRNAMLLAHPESTLVMEQALASANPGQFVKDAVLAGVPGAMLLMGRESLNNEQAHDALAWNLRAYEAGSAEAAYMLGMDAAESGDIPAAFKFFRAALKRNHLYSSYPLANLRRDFKAEDVNVSSEDFSEIGESSNNIAQRLMMNEALDILGEGTHPVQFRDESDIPWGTGTLFLVRWKGLDLALTARHVIDAVEANPNHVKIIVHQQDQPLHVDDDLALDFRDADGDSLDLHVWNVKTNVEQILEWNAWRLEEFCKSAKRLPENSAVFVVGFPNFEGKVDYDAGKMHRSPLVVKGRLATTYGGLYTIECAEFSTEVDGVSGGPVFYRHGGIFYFIGIAQRGGRKARTLYFLDSAEVLPALDHVVQRTSTCA